MANDRVISVDIGGKDPDSSGVGNMLFQQFEEARKNKAEAEQLDVTEAIKNKYRMQAAEQGNMFEQGMARLRAALNQEATDTAYARQQEAQKQAARHLEGMVGQTANQGIAMPGMTTDVGQVPEAGYAGTAVANPIAPGAVEIAKDQWGKNIDLHFKKLEAQTGMAQDAARKALFETMDRTDDTTAMEAKDWLNRFTALGADSRLLAVIEGYTKPGQGSKTEWSQIKTHLVPEEMKLASQSATKMALAREITARQTNIAQLKTRAAQLLANTKMDATHYRNLAALHQALSQEVAGLMKRHSELIEAIYQAPPEKQAGMQNQAAQLRAMAEDVQNQQQLVAQRMAGWQPLNPGTPPGQETPTAPGFQQLQTPGERKDRLGILPRTPKG